MLFAILRSDSSDHSSKLVLSFWVSLTALNLLLTSVPAILLYEQGRKPLDALFKLYNREVIQVSSTDMQRFHMFVEQMTHSDISISGGGFFIVTRSMLLTIVSVIVSYFLIILQFAMEQNSDHPAGNALNITSSID
uniref:Uncharacterized protein n=1 Tax=Plectus sambesii TaxID=2011161 RepID=A0A914UJ83_9BILA